MESASSNPSGLQRRAFAAFHTALDETASTTGVASRCGPEMKPSEIILFIFPVLVAAPENYLFPQNAFQMPMVKPHPRPIALGSLDTRLQHRYFSESFPDHSEKS